MGLLSKFVDHIGDLIDGAKKIFSGAMKVVGKVMSNKFVRFALLATTLVVPVLGMATAGWSAAGQGASFMAHLGSALGNVATGVAQMAVNAVTTPLKMLASGGSQVASMFNANGLAATLSNTAKTLGSAGESIFGAVQKDSLAQIADKLGFGNGGAAGGNTGMVADAGNKMGDAAGSSQQMADASQAGGQQMATNAASPTAPSAPSAPEAPSPSSTLTDPRATNNGLQQFNDGVKKLNDKSSPSFFDKALAWTNKNPEVAKMAFSAIGSAVTPDPAKQQADFINKRRQDDDAQWQNFNSNFLKNNQQQFDPAGNPIETDQFGNPIQPRFQPIDFTQRANQARNFINNQNYTYPLLKRPVA